MKNKKDTKRTYNELIKHFIFFIIAILLCFILCILILNINSAIVILALAFLALSISIPNWIYLILYLKDSFNCSKNKHSKIIENNLSSEFKVIFLNIDYLNSFAIPLHEQRVYKAKFSYYYENN